jgi:putative methionine-R-sulfoxide reductase with GAF domain
LDQHNLIIEATSDFQIKRRRFKPGEGVAGQVVQTGKTLLVPDVRQYPQFVPGFSSQIEERSMLLSPILFRSMCRGVISADMDELNGFNEYDQQLRITPGISHQNED